MCAYQQAARRYASHRTVTLGVLAINLCWLLPLASLTVAGYLALIAGLLLAYAPLVMPALWLKAGVADQSAGAEPAMHS